MIITAPVTDYIPASILTTHGDIIARGATIPERVPTANANAFLEGRGVGYTPWFRYIDSLLNQYMKGAGAGTNPTFSPLALRDTGVHIGDGTRAAAGAQVIAGVGYQASVIIFLALDNTLANMNWSVGFDNGTQHTVIGISMNHTELYESDTVSLRVRRDVGNRLEGVITAIGADGFTITWAIQGACSIRYKYLCLP